MNTVEQYFQKQLSCTSALRQSKAEEATASTSSLEQVKSLLGVSAG